MCFLEAYFAGEGDYAMGIVGVTSMNSMSNRQMTMTGSTDSKSKSIENEITGVQQQMQKISTKEDLSVNEKTNERKKLQKEISGLNTELKQHQEELRKSQKREIMMAELQEDKEPAKEEKSKGKIQVDETSLDKAAETKEEGQAGRQGTVIAKTEDGIVLFKGKNNQDENLGIDAEKKQADEAKEQVVDEKETKAADSDKDKDTGLSRKEMFEIVSTDASAKQTNRQETVIARIQGGIAILKGEINQDERSGADTAKKQAELEKMEQKEQRARSFPFSVLGEANNTGKSAAKAKVSGIKDAAQINIENNVIKLSQEDPTSPQRFYISFGN